MTEMTGRDIVTTAFDQQESPRVPVSVIGGGSWIVDRAGETFAGIKEDPARIAEVFVQAYRTVGHDLLWTGSNFINYPIHFLGCPIEDRTSDGPVLRGRVIESLKDVASLDGEAVLEQGVMQGIIRSHHLVADAIGKEVALLPTHWGPFTLAARIFGLESFMEASFDDPEALRDLLEFATELIWSVMEPALMHDDIIGANLSDPVASGDMISPDAFRKLAAPYLRKIVDRIKAINKYAMIHICGDTTGILQDVLDIGPHCFSLESKVNLRTAKEILGGKVCVAGNVSPTGAFLSGSPEAVIEEARACVAEWGRGGGYLLTLGCDFPKNVPIENVMALMSMKNLYRVN